MRGHIVTVCMVCLLCAAHTRCSLHTSHGHQVNSAVKDASPPLQPLLEGLGDPNRNVAQEKTAPLASSQTPQDLTMKGAEVWDDEAYIRMMFKKFSNGETMTVAGFERLLKAIGIERLPLPSKPMPSLNSQDERTAVSNNSSSNKSLHCVNTNEWVTAFTESQNSATDSSWTPSNSPKAPVKVSEINRDSYKKLCPILLYQVSEKSACSEHSAAERSVETHEHDGQTEDGDELVKDNMAAVWLYSTLSIVIISLCGLLGVAVIPVMQKVFYQKLIQFLVALAVGTLCGDALLHLLPHAMVTVGHDLGESSHTHSPHHSHLHSQEHHHHIDSMWKGLAAALGVVFFFLTEKCLTICAEWRKQRQRKSRTPVARVRVMRDTDEMNNSAVGEKLCKHKYSSYPYCYGDITKDGVVSSDLRVEKNGQPRRNSYPNDLSIDGQGADHLDSLDNHSNHNHLETSLNADHKICPTQEHRLLEKTPDMNGEGRDSKTDDKDYTIIIREHQSHHHGHSHTHGHVHSAPHSLSSVAWMVIMGDGLHNFTDGMAIGAAFANNIAGGFSTAVAVFCHELPHELGDFAVLLRAGMSAKQAVFYNILSSVLGFLGMVTGILLGDTKAASGWIFAIAAGMFLYIALVDMIPELSSSHSVEGRSFCQCLLQFLGLTTGIGIMLLIAYYEDELMRTFSD